jgi:hypothetical protein
LTEVQREPKSKRKKRRKVNFRIVKSKSFSLGEGVMRKSN